MFHCWRHLCVRAVQRERGQERDNLINLQAILLLFSITNISQTVLFLKDYFFVHTKPLHFSCSFEALITKINEIFPGKWNLHFVNKCRKNSATMSTAINLMINLVNVFENKQKYINQDNFKLDELYILSNFYFKIIFVKR